MNSIEVREFTPELAGAWKTFVQASNNGTLFHDLDFLSYHLPAKFNTRHLLFFQGGELVAVLPAAVVTSDDGRKILISPYGASVGGFALPAGQSTEMTLALVSRLKDHVCALGLDGIVMRLGPNIYMRDPNDQLSFALLAGGFQLTRRWLCHVIPLPKQPEALLAGCAKSKVRDARVGLRKGLTPLEVGEEQIGAFYKMLVQDRAKHQATPTHREEELVDLFRRVPGRVRLFLCTLNGQTVAGILLFVLNDIAAYTFYICQDDAAKALRPATALLLHVAQKAVADGRQWLDLGPTTLDDMSLNCGLATFKEEFGARGYCRDAWRWSRE